MNSLSARFELSDIIFLGLVHSGALVKDYFCPSDSETSKVELSANAISWWIKKLVSYAYSSASPSTLQLLQIPTQEPSLFRVTHEVRAMSSSIAWNHHQTSLQNLLKSCYWKGHTVFTDFYLGDISAVKSDKLVIASHVIASR